MRLGLRMAGVLGPSIVRVGLLSARIERMKPREPHWYLPVVGVDPDRRGRGIATALLRAVLDECDLSGAIACLDTASGGNQSFYEKLGFVLTGSLEVPGGPVVWAMRRAPSPRAAFQDRTSG